MFRGCMRRMLFVDLSSGKIGEERPDEELYRDFLGGYGIGARVLFSRQRPGIDPLGPDNTLGLVTGVLTGAPVPGGCRYTVVAKSPLTAGWGDANSGGDFGPNLKFSGYDAIFFTGVSEKPAYLVVRDGQAELRDAGHLWGRDTCQTEDALKGELGEEMSVACIGPAGEALSLLSCVINRKGRAAARSGLGAVMGSKRLKAVAVYGKTPAPLADKAEVDRLRRQYLLKLKDDQTARLLKTYGTLSLLGPSGTVTSAAHSGEAPVKNWGGIGVRDLTKAAASGSEPGLKSFEERKYACWRCPVGCGGYMKAGKEYEYARGAHKPEYETVAGFGTMCLNPNLESIIMANDICNRYGLDTISVGATIAFAIECYDNRLITREDTDGIELTWGSHRAIVAMTEKLAKREGFGAILADGVKVAAERIGKGSEKYAMHIGGQEVPYHDPRNSPRFAVAYKVDATPARHTQPGADGLGQEQKERNSFGQAYNAAGLCMWLNKALGATAVSEFMSAVTGHPYDVSNLTEAGERIANVRQAFNIREGLNPLERKVPDRVIGIPPQTEGPLAGKTVDLDARVSAYLKAMDWDPETAKPSKKRLCQLGLQDVANAL